MSHFEVGKKVIAIGNHSQGDYKRGQVFPLNGIKKSPCNCQYIDLDIGLKSKTTQLECSKCGMVEPSYGKLWVGSKHFAPYDDSISELTAEDILNEELTELLNGKK